jgi:cardiolipin synthase A/B
MPDTFTVSRAFVIIALIAIALQGGLLLLALFEPYLDYKITSDQQTPLSHPDFLNVFRSPSDSQLYPHNSIEVLTNGEQFYEAELEAIRGAQHSINLEAFIFRSGEVTRRFVEAMTERARAGVKVHLVLDAIGSFRTSQAFFNDLTEAGGEIAWYHPLSWYTWPRINNRTHRELLIVDGRIGFIGGAGFADHWLISKERDPRWRDSMFLVRGDAVAGLQSAFVENWVEASGKLLKDPAYFDFVPSQEGTPAMVINSSPSAGRSTRGRIAFQTLIAAAEKSIHINTPYFLPDSSLREEFARAVERGADVKIITPGKKSDQTLTRSGSRRLYGELLQAGVRIFEYQPAMMHAKILIVDGLWAVVGSTNMDNRSFGLNDEVNLVAIDADFARRLEEDFQRDLRDSREISYEEWRKRSLRERFVEFFSGILERQQ